MTDKSKLQYLTFKKTIFRYSQSSSNSIDNYDSESNLYSHSKGLKNGEKGYLSGVAKNKNYETDNKGWNRRMDEDDDYKTHYSSKKSENFLGSTSKYSRDNFTLVNGSEMDKQSQKYGNKKYSNKDLAISSMGTRNAKNSTDNFRHYGTKEQPKRGTDLDKSKTMVDFYKTKKNGIENYTGNNADKYNRQKNNTNKSYMNVKKGELNSIYGKPNDVGRFDRSIDNRTKNSSYEDKRKDYNKTDSKPQIKNKTNQYEQKNIQQNIQRTKNNKTPFIKYNQEVPSLYSKNRYSQNQIYDKTKLQQQKQLQISKYDSKKQPSTTIQNTIYTRNPHNSEINSKFPKTNYKTQGEYLRNNSQIKPQTTYDKNKQRQPQGRELPKYHSTQKERIRKPGSSYDTELIIHEHLLERPTNLVRLEISVEKKKVDRDLSMKEIEPRKHETIISLKKRTQSYDTGKLLNNTKRLNDSVEQKKEKPDRPKLSNYVRVNLTPEKRKEEKPIRQPGTRKHEVLCSSKKKNRQNFDKDGNPLTNTIRVNDNQEKKKEKPEQSRMTNYSRFDSSPDKNKKDSKPKIQPSSRKNELPYNSKNERIPSYEQNRKYKRNDERNNAFKERNKEDKFNKDKYKHNQFQKTKTNYDTLTSPYSNSNKNYLNRTKTNTKTTPYSSYTQPIQNKDKDKDKNKDNNKKYDVYKKPQNIQEKTSFPRHTRQNTGLNSSLSNITKDEKNKPSYYNPFTQSKYQTQSGFYPSRSPNDNNNKKSKTNEGWYPNQKNNTTTHYNQKNEDYNKKYSSYKLNNDKTNNKMEKSDKINISYNSPGKGNSHTNYFSNNNYSSKPSGKDKSKNFNIQSKVTPYKQPQSELKYFSPNNKALNSNKEYLSNIDKYYHPNKDDKKKYIVREEKSPFTTSPKKYNEKDRYPKDEPRYQGYIQKEQYDQYKRTQTGSNNNKDKDKDKSKHNYISLNKEKYSSYLNLDPSKRAEGSKTTETKNYKSLYQSTFKEQEITKKYENNNTKNKNESYLSSYQKNKSKETPRFNQNSSNIKEYNHLKNNKSYENWKSKNLINQNLSINSPTKQSMKETSSYVNKSNKTSYNINNQTKSKDYGDYYNKDNKMNTSLNSNKNNKIEKTSYSSKKEEIYSYNYNSKSTIDKHKFNTILEEETEDGYKNGKIKNSKYNSYGQSNLGQDYDLKNYKYKFLTTKEICQQFWKSIEIGELPISMFDPNKNSGSRLISFFSPEKNYQNEKFTKSVLSSGDTGYGQRNLNLNQVKGSNSVRNVNEAKQYNRSGYY